MWSQASPKEIAVYILSCLTSSRRGQKYSPAAWRAASKVEAQPFFDTCLLLSSEPSRERSFWCSSQEQTQAIRQSQASHRTYLLRLTKAMSGWARICLFLSLWLHKKISPAGRKSRSLFGELYQVLAKEMRTSIRFLCSSGIFWCICTNARFV